MKLSALPSMLKIETSLTLQVNMLITFYPTDDALNLADVWFSFFLNEKKRHSPFPRLNTRRALVLLLGGPPIEVTIATLINRTSVDVTWCYQILIKLLKIASSEGRATMGGPDSQYPVENSTETAHSFCYRKAYSCGASAYGGRKASFLFLSTHHTYWRSWF